MEEVVMKAFLRATSFCAYLLVGVSAQAQETLTGIEFFERRGINFDTVQIRIETVSPGLYVLFGAGGNVAVSIGDQGVLVVDDQFPTMVPRIRAAIRELGGDDVDFVINTHWHFDHTDGNPLFGRDGSWIVSQVNSRRMMTDNQLINLVNALVEQPPSSPDGLPVITYENRMRFYFNGEQIDLMHFGPAHTTGDAAVVFRGHNVVHMGDVFNSGAYPFIDADNGGGLDGVILFCEAVLNEIDEDTIVIPGHGPVAKYEDLIEYVLMLRTIRDRIAELIARGASLDEVIAAKPTAEWDEVKGDPIRLLDRAFASLTR
jgi:glyoxylase-like metal-dependent hydrolase (beta-lactamase superfamily II)